MKKLLAVIVVLAVALLFFLSLKYEEPLKVQMQITTEKKEPVRIIMKVTAYDPDEKCVGVWVRHQKTSTGKDAKTLDGVAADPELLPYGTEVWIPDIGFRTVDDTGGAMRQSAKEGLYHIDVRMASHKEAEKWGVQWKLVELIE